MASLDWDEERRVFLEYCDKHRGLLHAAEMSFRTVLQALLANETIPIAGITSRLKAPDEALRKFERKYRTRLEETGAPYRIRDHITDLIGIRIVCLYETDVPRIRDLIADQFEVIDVTDKTLLLEGDSTFGYKGLHLDLSLNDTRRALPEYRGFGAFPFELQIRTIVQDAWSEVDHRIKYKKSIPSILARRINVLAALFELADREFVAIRDATVQLENKVNAGDFEKSGTESKEVLNAFSFLSAVKDTFPAYPFLSVKVDGFVQELLEHDPSLSDVKFIDVLRRHYVEVQHYAKFLAEEHKFTMNPFTMIRHMLYVADPDKFFPLMYLPYRERFDRWREDFLTQAEVVEN